MNALIIQRLFVYLKRIKLIEVLYLIVMCKISIAPKLKHKPLNHSSNHISTFYK